VNGTVSVSQPLVSLNGAQADRHLCRPEQPLDRRQPRALRLRDPDRLRHGDGGPDPRRGRAQRRPPRFGLRRAHRALRLRRQPQRRLGVVLLRRPVDRRHHAGQQRSAREPGPTRSSRIRPAGSCTCSTTDRRCCRNSRSSRTRARSRSRRAW
jgi:hypothetical protein